MKKAILPLVFLGTTVVTSAQRISADLDTLVGAYANELGFQGAVVVAKKGKAIYERSCGYKNKRTQAPIDTNTIFEIGSVTDQFTSAIILQLAEQYRLSLEDRLSKYIPDYPEGNEITIEQLLTHTSGIPNYPREADTHPVSRDSLISRFKFKRLDFTPGQKYRFSNSGYFLLGFIIEKVTGRSYFDAVRQRVFLPLHMDHSGFDFAGLESPDKAIGYATRESADPAPVIDSTVSFAGGAIYTTVGDLYKWDRGLLTGKILKPASLERAYTPHLAGYGYGVVNTVVDGKRALEHSGGISGFVTDLLRIPEDEICVVVWSNQESDANLPNMAHDICSILDGKAVRLPKAKVAITLDTALMREYIGNYQITPAFSIVISLEAGRLYAQAGGQPKAELYAEKKDLFFTKVAEAEFEFVRGVTGQIDKLILHQGGQNVPANRR